MYLYSINNSSANSSSQAIEILLLHPLTSNKKCLVSIYVNTFSNNLFCFNFIMNRLKMNDHGTLA